MENRKYSSTDSKYNSMEKQHSGPILLRGLSVCNWSCETKQAARSVADYALNRSSIILVISPELHIVTPGLHLARWITAVFQLKIAVITSLVIVCEVRTMPPFKSVKIAEFRIFYTLLLSSDGLAVCDCKADLLVLQTSLVCTLYKSVQKVLCLSSLCRPLPPPPTANSHHTGIGKAPQTTKAREMDNPHDWVTRCLNLLLWLLTVESKFESSFSKNVMECWSEETSLVSHSQIRTGQSDPRRPALVALQHFKELAGLWSCQISCILSTSFSKYITCTIFHFQVAPKGYCGKNDLPPKPYKWLNDNISSDSCAWCNSTAFLSG